ncbi:fimbria/pilus periplasmic chaperone [Enterobacter hormaechei]|uniref:fimbria/pilus periplasmic chaperone n=1 Tax=Enterobacter hormaechei TaxID=158836 RepID=UPI00106F0E77|nr:fimbria/pilus periplasmic chaperone [Enterobacter hormaechei]
MKLFPCRIAAVTLLGLSATLCNPAFASGGLSFGASRVVYPASAQQTTFSVRNNSTDTTYLMQSWVENADGKKTTDFIITPPLYTSEPGNENTLRIVSVGASHAHHRESLYYLNIKAVPSADKSAIDKSRASLMVATVMRIKLFVRPDGLQPAREKAADALELTRQGGKLNIHNPTPYWLTLTGMKAGDKALNDVMVPPLASASVPLPAGSGSTVTWQSVNDYGGTDNGRSSVH